MSKHLGCMSTVGIIAAFPPKLFLSLALLCHLYRANPFPCLFFPPSASVKHKSIQSAHCQIFLVCGRTCVRVWLWEPERECAFTLWGRSFPRVRDVSEAQGFAQLCSEFFFLAATFVLLLTSKNWPGLCCHNNFIWTVLSKLWFAFFFSCTSLLRLMRAQQRHNFT